MDVKLTSEEYHEKLKQMNQEELYSEFCDCIGNECRDLEDLIDKGGDDAIIEYLDDWFTCQNNQ